MKAMRDLFDRLPWWTLRPDAAITAGNPAPLQALSSRDGRVALVYVPGGAAVQLDLGHFGAVARAEWLNPRTGAATAISRTLASGSGRFQPPSAGDWLLLIARSQK